MVRYDALEEGSWRKQHVREDWPRAIEEFESWHARQPERWEFIDGHPRMIAPASMKHSIIKTNVGFTLHQALVYTPLHGADRRSADRDRGDLGGSRRRVTCRTIDLSTPVIAEPVLVVEVMSPSSEAVDAGRKWFSYRKILSLRHYLVLSRDERVVQVHSRAGELRRERCVSGGAIELDDPPVRLEVEAIHAGTDVALIQHVAGGELTAPPVLSPVVRSSRPLHEPARRPTTGSAPCRNVVPVRRAARHPLTRPSG